jgi:glycosyltransferase involved in cell wall biosynthesis
MNFSVLTSIYHATKPEELNCCLKNLVRQKLKPAQIVLVRDGPVQPAIEKCIEKYAIDLPFEHLKYIDNRGLGAALQDGLHACAHDIVARVDSDDRSLPERFALQTAYLEDRPDISVVGSWMSEHYERGNQSSTHIRKTPLEPSSIARYARRRNPLNHPTVMFRKSHVLSSGGYQPCLMFEDYFLWVRMLTQGYRLANMSTILVETQVDPTYFIRRGGIAYLRHELTLLGKFRQLGFFSRLDSTVFVLTRLPMRLIPVSFRKYLYRSLLRDS